MLLDSFRGATTRAIWQLALSEHLDQHRPRQKGSDYGRRKRETVQVPTMKISLQNICSPDPHPSIGLRTTRESTPRIPIPLFPVLQARTGPSKTKKRLQTEVSATFRNYRRTISTSACPTALSARFGVSRVNACASFAPA